MMGRELDDEILKLIARKKRLLQRCKTAHATGGRTNHSHTALVHTVGTRGGEAVQRGGKRARVHQRVRYARVIASGR